MITVALAKGALLKDSVARFAAAGLDFSAVLDKDNRQLMVPTPCGRARALLVRNGDVPTYVAYGQAQLGVCLLYTSPSPRDATLSRMPSSA